MRRIALALLYAAASAAEPPSRDAWRWPFASDSIWNTPIGAGAVYVAARLPRSGWCGVDVERHIRLSASDPVREVYPPSSWGTRWPGDTAFPHRNGEIWRMPVPDALIVPDAKPPSTPNACCAFLMPDGRTLRQLEPACRTVAGAHIVGWPSAPQDLYGAGILGTHWGSGLSTLGGSIRVGELTGADPIRHALKINIWGKRLCYDAATRRGWRWPADRHDGAAPTAYQGGIPALRMGALLALPPATSASTLGVTTAVGRKLVAAFQDYGAYVADDSGWDAYDLCCEIGVIEEVRRATGLELSAGGGALFAELQRIVQALAVVDNNAADRIGGGGAPRLPLAPALVDPAIAAPDVLAATPVADGTALSWRGRATTETGYEVWRQGVGGTWGRAATLAAGAVAWTDAAPPASAVYRVRAMRGTNASAWSGIVTTARSRDHGSTGAQRSPVGDGDR